MENKQKGENKSKTKKKERNRQRKINKNNKERIKDRRKYENVKFGVMAKERPIKKKQKIEI